VPTVKPRIITQTPDSPRSKLRREISCLQDKRESLTTTVTTIMNNRFLSSILGYGDLRVQAAQTLLDHCSKHANITLNLNTQQIQHLVQVLPQVQQSLIANKGELAACPLYLPPAVPTICMDLLPAVWARRLNTIDKAWARRWNPMYNSHNMPAFNSDTSFHQIQIQAKLTEDKPSAITAIQSTLLTIKELTKALPIHLTQGLTQQPPLSPEDLLLRNYTALLIHNVEMDREWNRFLMLGEALDTPLFQWLAKAATKQVTPRTESWKPNPHFSSQ
jgi:hypothetical protein